ncbi:DUF397 domain-containing protein [Nocardiopsis ganjiahuensis]|uniref:DUF397 domain-containing protein n=1 Tax=Nocardiopsis ganjiahuensis TaxID=239984 RepID=UPI00034C63C0|nr:DUF397 domain-containing protein [Nocardiopsis ganjiahuensis]
MSDVESDRWRKSSYSGGGKDCVEVAEASSKTLVRDSKQPELGHLAFASGGWNAFLSSVKAPHTG